MPMYAALSYEQKTLHIALDTTNTTRAFLFDSFKREQKKLVQLKNSVHQENTMIILMLTSIFFSNVNVAKMF